MFKSHKIIHIHEILLQTTFGPCYAKKGRTKGIEHKICVIQNTFGFICGYVQYLCPVNVIN